MVELLKESYFQKCWKETTTYLLIKSNSYSQNSKIFTVDLTFDWHYMGQIQVGYFSKILKYSYKTSTLIMKNSILSLISKQLQQQKRLHL